MLFALRRSNEHFASKQDGSISLWNLYNLLTEANKSSYVDTFLDRYAGMKSTYRDKYPFMAAYVITGRYLLAYLLVALAFRLF